MLKYKVNQPKQGEGPEIIEKVKRTTKFTLKMLAMIDEMESGRYYYDRQIRRKQGARDVEMAETNLES